MNRTSRTTSERGEGRPRDRRCRYGRKLCRCCSGKGRIWDRMAVTIPSTRGTDRQGRSEKVVARGQGKWVEVRMSTLLDAIP